MIDWPGLRVLCLGGAGQTGEEICRQLAEKGAGTIFVHDLALARSQVTVARLAAQCPGTRFVASAGNLFHPQDLATWEFVGADGPAARVCRETGVQADPSADVDGIGSLFEARLGALTPEVVRASLIWNLVDAYRPAVVVDSVNTATVLGYAGDLIQCSRAVAASGRRVLEALRSPPEASLALDDVRRRLERLGPEAWRALSADLADTLLMSMRMTASLDVACMIRYVQCLHGLFHGEATAVPGFLRFVKVHTTGLGGMGFNIRYTHGDTGEPGLSTKLLGKVGAAGQLTQLLLTLAHTPGCDVRVVVPATLVGWVEPPDALIHDGREPIPLVDSESLVPCDGSTSLGAALADAGGRITPTGRSLEVPYLSSGENKPYAIEDIYAVTALGQMGCVTKEEVGRATVECIEGDSRYDVLAAIDAALLLPTQTAAVERERKLHKVRSTLPSVSVGNLGPTTAKLLYEIEILRAVYETVGRLVREADEMDMTLRACSYLLGEEGTPLRRQIVSLGIPVFLRKGPGDAGVLLGDRLLFPDAKDAAAMATRLDPEDPAVRSWLDRGWIDLSGARMAWWRERFHEIHAALQEDRGVSRNWFDPDQPFRAGQLLAYLYSISGGQRKEYM